MIFVTKNGIIYKILGYYSPYKITEGNMAANNQNKKNNASSAKKKTGSSQSKSVAQQGKGPAPTKPVRTQTKTNGSSKSKSNHAEEAAAAAAIRQRTAIVLSAVTAILLAATFIKGERVWLAFHEFIFGVSGICAYVWPLMLIYIIVMLASDKSAKALKSLRGRLIGASLATGMLSGIVHVFSNAVDAGELKEQIAYVWNLKDTVTVGSGGVIGAIFGGVPEMLFGKTAAAVVLIVLLVATLMFVTGSTLLGIYIFIKERVDSARIKRREREEADYPDDRASFVKKKREYVPVDIGPEAYGSVDNDGMYIDELVGNAEKKDIKPKSKTPKPFIDVKPEPEASAVEPALPLDEIIKKVNGSVKLKDKPDSKDKTEPKKDTKAEKAGEPVQVFHTYQKPPIECLKYANNAGAMNYEDELKNNATKLVDTLNSFGVSTKIVDICRGPSVTRYELQPAAGVKISRITSLADDIALALASSGVRIEAPIPNKSAIGIEIPNKNRATVSLREIIETPVYRNAKSKLNVGLGKDITGNTICADIAKMPHLLIAGTTGSGKSVCLNAMIVSILYNSTPDEVKLLMIDPKQVEFTVYNGIPHLLVPVVSDPRKAAGALGWAVTEMLQRYKMFSENAVRDIKGYNKLAATSETLTPMPHIVIFIDELSDLMMAAPNEVEDSICRLAQMARAAGMHLVIATQRPSVNVITGIIKANIPSRIALSVSSQVDSRTIIDTAGAEKLLGYGDMLFSPVGVSKPVRVQGCFLSDEEVESVVKFIKTQGEEKQYDEKVMEEIERQAVLEKKPSASSSSSDGDSGEGGDEMIPKAIEVVVEAQMASTTLLQRKLKLGYARAARIIDELEQRQIVGPFEGSKPRKVLISKQQWMEMNALGNASAPIENPIETDAYEEDEEE